MINGNYIKINRSILNWEWYDDMNTFKLFMHLLLTVNWKDSKWRDNDIQRGQRVSSYAKLSEETGLSIKQIRGSLEKLKKTGEVTHQNCHTYGLFTVNNYDKYQTEGTPNDTSNDIPLGNKRATIEERKELNNNTSEIKKRNSDKKFSVDSNEYKLAEYMIKKIKEICPSFKEPNIQRWCSDFDKILRIDKRSPNETVSLITKVYEDDFWKKNILSPDKLRKQYDRLIIQFKESA